MRSDFVLTSESVTEGHPDKLCDQISDALVDHFLQQDPYSRIVAECAVSTAILFIAARFSSRATVDIPGVARRVIRGIGYHERAFDGDTCSIITSQQDLHIDANHELDERTLADAQIDAIAAKNQVTVFGFACNQSPAYMPLPIWLAHRFSRGLAQARQESALPYLTPDGKTQVGVEFRDRRPARIHSITVIASQRKPAEKGGPDLERLRRDVRKTILDPVFSDEALKPDAKTMIFVNPDGPFVGAGPSAHSGLTGRKGGVDTYGEYARQSGSALSGKGPLRVDRTGAYVARYAAKNVVAAGLADECEVQLSYVIGLARPVSVQVETFGTGKLPDQKLRRLIEEHFDFRPAAIIARFNLRFLPAQRPEGFYRRLASYGHVGRLDLDLPWEALDKVEALREDAGIRD